MKNMKKVFAFVLALAMILTTYQPTTTYAATKAPTISAKKMTLQVGSKKTLTIKNAGKNATLKWSSNKKTVATVSKKGVVKAVKAGTANVKCKVVTKSKKHYTLTCKVTVKNAAVSKTVSTQKALAAALKDKNVKNLTIKTDKEVAFNIPSGNYGKVNLTVDAPNADVVNAGTFKSINIKAIKPNTWKEKAKGNTITVTADDARIVVEAGASLSKVTVSQEGGKIKIEAAGTIDAIQIDAAVDVSLAVDGTVGEVAVSAPAKVAVEGKTTTAIPVKVEETAKGADVTSSTPVEVKAATEISLNLSKGAEGSKVETTGENAQVAVKNDTTDVIKVTTPAGTQEVAKDTTSKVDNTGKVTDTTTNTSGDNNGGSTGGGSTSGGGSSSGGSTSGGGSSSGGSTSGGGSSSGGSTSGGGSSSGGSVTPELTAGTLEPISVLSKNKISVYPSDIEEVPETLAKENVSVKNQQGETVNVADIKRDTDGNGGYYITLASDLTDGEYTFTMILEGKKYAGTYTVNNDVLNKMDKLGNLIAEYEQTIPKISSTALTEPGFCVNALKDGIAEQMIAHEDYHNLNINVEYKGNHVIADSKLTADVYVAIYAKGDKYAAHERYDRVTFDCSAEEVKVEKPLIVCKMKNSIVVECADNQQYICMEKEKDAPTEVDWNGDNVKDSDWTDDIGNIEFENLKTDVSYVVWTRIIATNMVAQSEEFTLKENMNPVGSVIKALGDKEIDATVTGWQPGGLVVRVPVNVAIAWYGDRDDENACVKITSSEDKFGDFTDDDHAADLDNKVRLNTNELGDGDGYIEFIGVENLGVGEKTFTFSIQTVYNGKVMAEQAYTAKFTILQDTLDKKPSENAGE